MIGRGSLVLVGDDLFPLGPQDHLVECRIEVGGVDGLLVFAGCQERGLIHEVREIGPAHPHRAAGDLVEIDVGCQGDVPGMDLEDLQTSLLGRQIDRDMTIEPAWPKQGGVEHVGAIGCGQNDHAFAGGEAVHLGQDLIQGLLPLVMTTAQPGTRTRPTASISSMNKMHGLFSLAVLNMSRTRLAPTPTNIWMNSEPEIE